MKCAEYFYNQEKAIDFMETLEYESEPEIVKN